MKVAVDLVICRGCEFLFVVRKHPPFKGALALPGGFVEEDESTEEAACRELAEETGIMVAQSAEEHPSFLSKGSSDSSIWKR